MDHSVCDSGRSHLHAQLGIVIVVVVDRSSSCLPERRHSVRIRQPDQCRIDPAHVLAFEHRLETVAVKTDVQTDRIIHLPSAGDVRVHHAAVHRRRTHGRCDPS